MVPSGWEKTTFGEHIDLLNGFAFKSALYSDDENDIKLLRGDNIEPNKLRWRDVKRWSKTEYESLEKYHLKVDDFIIAMDRTWITAGLKVAEVKQEDLPCLLVQRVSRIRSLPTLCQDLIKHHFSSYQFEQYVKSVQTETAVPHISATQIREFSLLLPPLQEQQKIAKILSTWDKAISTTERLIKNSTQQKKALMQQLLTGKKRLLDDEGKRFAGEWESKLFKNILKLDRGSSPRPIIQYMTDSEDGVNWIKIGDTKGEGLYINSTKEKITKEGAEKSRKVSKGEVVLSNSMSYGKPYILNIDGYIHDGWFVIRKFEKNIDVNFLIQILSSELIQKQYKRLAAGGVVSNISSELVYAVKVDLPSIPEQQKIATVLTNADKEIELLEQQLADLQQEKKALMQVLLTGKKRVVVDGN